MKMRRERIPGIRRRKIREYKNYNNYSYIYIKYTSYILTTSSKKTYEAYEVVFGTRIRVCYTCVYV